MILSFNHNGFLFIHFNNILFFLFFILLQSNISSLWSSIMDKTFAFVFSVDLWDSGDCDQVVFKDFTGSELLFFLFLWLLVHLKFFTGLWLITHHGLIHSFFHNFIEILNIFFRNTSRWQGLMDKNLFNLRLVVLVFRPWYIIGSFNMSLYKIFVMSILLISLLLIELLLLLSFGIFSWLGLLAHHGFIHLLWLHVIELIKVLLLLFIMDLLVLCVSLWCTKLNDIVWLAMMLVIVFFLVDWILFFLIFL